MNTDNLIGQPVKLEWRDALGVSSELTEREVLEMQPVLTTSFGLLKLLDKNRVIIASSVGRPEMDEEHFSDALCVPRKWMVSITPLEVKES